MVVVLPQPLLPRRPKVSPCFTSKERSLITVLSAKTILKCLTSMIFCADFVAILVIFYHFTGEIYSTFAK